MEYKTFNEHMSFENPEDFSDLEYVWNDESYFNFENHLKQHSGEPQCIDVFFKALGRKPYVLHALNQLVIERKVDRYYLRLPKEKKFKRYYLHGRPNAELIDQFVGFSPFANSQEHLYDFFYEHPGETYNLKQLKEVGFTGRIDRKLAILVSKDLIFDFGTGKKQNRNKVYFYLPPTGETQLMEDGAENKFLILPDPEY
ncbi:MAG: hypothetical protein V3U54_13320 [Thermodesulfobacteriota bacterium]